MTTKCDMSMVVKDGKVCVMVYDVEKQEWVYIPERELKEVW